MHKCFFSLSPHSLFDTLIKAAYRVSEQHMHCFLQLLAKSPFFEAFRNNRRTPSLFPKARLNTLLCKCVN